MSLLDVMQRDVVTISPDATVVDAARRMTERDVGCLVVVVGRKPVGVLTDRDVTLRVVAEGIDPSTTPIRAVMSGDPAVLEEELGLFEALEVMKDRRVRRFPVVDAEGDLSGFFTVDDVLSLLGLEMSAVACIVDQRQDRPVA